MARLLVVRRPHSMRPSPPSQRTNLAASGEESVDRGKDRGRHRGRRAPSKPLRRRSGWVVRTLRELGFSGGTTVRIAHKPARRGGTEVSPGRDRGPRLAPLLSGSPTSAVVALVGVIFSRRHYFVGVCAPILSAKEADKDGAPGNQLVVST